MDPRTWPRHAGAPHEVWRSFLGRTGAEICAADTRNKRTCTAVKYVYVTEDNHYGQYSSNDKKCSDSVQNAWPWGEDYGAPDTLAEEWGHGDTLVVCCR